MLNASGNQVQQLSVQNNLVDGVLGDASVFSYLGTGGSANSASIAGGSGPITGPQVQAGGLVNAATFQQRALAPGSLVSLFGLDLNGATVQFDGISAPIFYASSSQLNLQVPWELQGTSSASVTVRATRSRPSYDGPDRASRPRYLLPGRATGRAGRHRESRRSRGGRQLARPCRGLSADLRYRAGGGEQSTQDRGRSLGSPLSNLIGNPAATIGGMPAPVRFRGTGSRLYRALPGERAGAAGSSRRRRRSGDAFDRRYRFEHRYHFRSLAVDEIWAIREHCCTVLTVAGSEQ